MTFHSIPFDMQSVKCFNKLDEEARGRLTQCLQALIVTHITSLPRSSLDEPNRWMFAIESAHWSYLDNHRIELALPSLSLVTFTTLILSLGVPVDATPADAPNIVASFTSFKKTIPKFGCIMTDEQTSSHVVLVLPCYMSLWQLPTGKIEFVDIDSGQAAALRESEEETGFPLSSFLGASKDSPLPSVEVPVARASATYFVVRIPCEPGPWRHVPTTVNEIKEVRWFPIDKLPPVIPTTMSAIMLARSRGLFQPPLAMMPSATPSLRTAAVAFLRRPPSVYG